MALRDDLLRPILGENPSGARLLGDPIYERIKEARRQDDDMNLGDWRPRDQKVADFRQVAKLAQEALATKSKDLEVAVWLSEALLKTEGFGGLRAGFDLCRGLMGAFWDTLYPEMEGEDDIEGKEDRAAKLSWIAAKLDIPVKMVPLVTEGYNWFKYQESRKVGYETQQRSDKEKKEREKLIKEKRLTAEDFDKAFEQTPKAFYVGAEKNLNGCLESLQALEQCCDDRFGANFDEAPSFRTLREALEEVRDIVHLLLEKKRETEPDPVEEEIVEVAVADGAGGEAPDGLPAIPGVVPLSSSEPPDVRKAIAGVAAAAAFLRQREPHSPAPYLMMRGLRWGELRAAAELSDPTLLEAPPTELRQHVKRLALNGKWEELLEAAENSMALPCSRAWLDLQRLVVEACLALGAPYHPIAKAIQSELKALIRDVPQVITATLMDDTPAANAQTQAWLKELVEEPTGGTAESAEANGPVSSSNSSGWRQKFADSYQLATEAMRAGHERKAFEILFNEIERQRSGRGRFKRKLQLVEMCISSGKESIAQPILEDLATAIENHKLEDWEDREMVAGALEAIMKASVKIQGNDAEKRKIFERICRLDPARALEF